MNYCYFGQLLAFAILTVGCYGPSSQPPSRSGPPDNFVFDVSGDDSFVASIEHPSSPSYPDGKYHFKINIQKAKKGGPKVEQETSVERGRSTIALSNVSKPVVVEKRPPKRKPWKELHGYLRPETDILVKIDQPTVNTNAVVNLQGICDNQYLSSCWDSSGNSSESTEQLMRRWRDQMGQSSSRLLKFNRFIFLKKNFNKSQFSYSANVDDLGHEKIAIDAFENWIVVCVDIEEDAIDFPLAFRLNWLSGKRTDWFKVDSPKSVNVDGFNISRVKVDESEFRGLRFMALDFNPVPKEQFWLEAKAVESGPAEMRSAHFTNQNQLKINLWGLEELQYFRLCYVESQSILWEMIPSHPKFVNE